MNDDYHFLLVSAVPTHLLPKLRVLDTDAGSQCSDYHGFSSTADFQCILIYRNTVHGKIEYTVNKDQCTVHWIVAPGHGTVLMEFFERQMRAQGCKYICLRCVISNGEDPDTVMRRLNFYIKLNYRCTNYGFNAAGAGYMDISFDMRKLLFAKKK
jgi:hypothetical protein